MKNDKCTQARTLITKVILHQRSFIRAHSFDLPITNIATRYLSLTLDWPANSAMCACYTMESLRVHVCVWRFMNCPQILIDSLAEWKFSSFHGHLLYYQDIDPIFVWAPRHTSSIYYIISQKNYNFRSTFFSLQFCRFLLLRLCHYIILSILRCARS